MYSKTADKSQSLRLSVCLYFPLWLSVIVTSLVNIEITTDLVVHVIIIYVHLISVVHRQNFYTVLHVFINLSLLLLLSLKKDLRTKILCSLGSFFRSFPRDGEQAAASVLACTMFSAGWDMKRPVLWQGCMQLTAGYCL